MLARPRRIGHVPGLRDLDLEGTQLPEEDVEIRKVSRYLEAVVLEGVLDFSPMKTKALSFHWEFMFARPMFETDDMDEQGGLLDEVSKLVDEGALQNTATKSFEEISTDSLNEALTHQASGAAIGKTVLG